MESKQDEDTSENRAYSKKATKDKLNIEHYSPKERIYSDGIKSMDGGTMDEPKENIFDNDNLLYGPQKNSEEVKPFKKKFYSNYKNVWETKVSKVCDKELLKYIKACNDDFNALRFKINRDAQAYNPATNVVILPKNFKMNEANELSRRRYYSNIQVDKATISEASTSRAITVGADQAGKKLEDLSDEELIRSTKNTPLCLSGSDRNNSETEDKGETSLEGDASSRNAPSSDSSTTTQSTTMQDPTIANDNTSGSPPQPTDIGEQNNDRKLKNSRPLSLEATTYELDKFSKNAMLVINQEEVEGYPELRIGTEDDVTALKQTFGNFGFEVEEHKDKTILEVFNILKEFSERDFTDYGCIAVAILTHGTRYGLLRAKDLNQMYSELSVLDYFKASNNPTLLTKPIILIIQACRGDDDSIGFPVNAELKIRKDLDGDVEPYYLPLHADTLVLHSSFYGKPSFRPGNGSWFIQTLCEKINLLSPTYDLMSVITEVQREVAIKKVSVEYSLKTKEMEVNKQMPVMTSTLLRKLYLMKGEDEHWQTKSLLKSCDTLEAGFCLNNMGHDLIGVKVPCSCFVEHFTYLKNCLSHFVDEHPIDRKDSTARHLLQDANTINENYDLPKAKITLIAISNFLENNSRRFNYHKYLHFYRVHDVDLNKRDGDLTVSRILSQNYVLIGVACIMSTFILRLMEECFLRV